MQSPFMRNVALVAAANAAIMGKAVRPLWPDYLAFKFYKSCVFLDDKQAVLAADPNAWIAGLKGRARGLWLHHAERDSFVADRMTAGFVGGGARWIIEAVRDGGSDLWEGGDRFAEPKTRQPWTAGYTRIATGWTRPREPMRPMADAIRALDETLEKIAAFARTHADNFVQAFETAREALRDPQAKIVRSDELLPFAALSTEASQLWAAAESAWVFGGMGSWNDMGFDGDDGKLYDQLSSTLFNLLNEAMTLVANSTFPG